ncbi:Nuclear_LIM interactor-interacting factor [Hexamita inflata]|uniref:Nuclear LIM interactor-interacting factor n=1 Tax=Hexamita inflata TaxID=28002 RepID=A0AA86U670_9EUKA|nr:Nuclear LIM interactor-interacting factor [Hexamita inflata]
MQNIVTQVQQPSVQKTKKTNLFSNCLKCGDNEPTIEKQKAEIDKIHEQRILKDDIIQVEESPDSTWGLEIKQVAQTAQTRISTESFRTKKLLVLDLDETLVHSSFQPVNDADLTMELTINEPSVTKYQLFIYLRPYLDEFLKQMSELFEICIFTASMQVYCDAVVDKIDLTQLCKYRLYRNHCTQKGPIYVKDISRLGFDLKDVVIMDNSAISFSMQPENGILCPEFFNDKKDTYLRTVIPFMKEIAEADDVRDVLKK